MGILQLYPEKEFYTNVNLHDFCQGQFCWIPVPHINSIPRILDVQRSSPTEHDEVRFELRNANQSDDFRRCDRNLPLKNLGLRSNEELLVQHAKKRPGVIISSKVDIFPEITQLLRQKGRKHLQEDSIFLIPGYGIESENRLTGFPQEMVARIRCLLYRQFFYFPNCSKFEEGVARFDRIQVVISRDPAAIESTEFCLSEEVLSLFIGMFLYCISGVENENIKAARDLVKEAYPYK